MNMMNNVNSVILEGNLTRDAEVREPKPGFRVAKLSVATSRMYRKRDGQLTSEVSYIDVEAHGQLIDYCKEKGLKGATARIVGRIRQDRWDDKDGQKRSKTFIVADHIDLNPPASTKQAWAEAIKAHEAARSSAEAANYASAARAQNEIKPVESHEDAVF